MRIKKISSIEEEQEVFDLTTKNNHNFFAEEVCVHNCVRGVLKKLGKANPKQKDIDEWNKKHVPAFEKGCVKLGIPQPEIDKIIKDVVSLSKYSFNKSHSVAYSRVAMETVYLARYFRSYYYSSSLTYDAGKKDALKESIRKVAERGYKIEPPDVNKSGLHFAPDGMKINFGLCEIKGIGDQPGVDIIEHRPYTSILDFILKTIGTSVNKRITMALLGGGAFDNLIDKNRKYYENIITRFYEKKKSTKTIPLLEEKWDECVEEIEKCETTPEEYMAYEDTYLGGQFFYNRFTAIQDKIETLYKKGYCLRDFKEIREKNLSKQYCFVYLSSYRYHTQKDGREMLFTVLEDRTGEKADVPIFGSYFAHLKEKFFGEGFYLMDLYPTEDGKIMFGSRNWVSNPNTIKNMMARVSV